MAVRSGAGIGVTVSLIVFIIATISMLVMAIVFYTGKTKESEARTQADSALATYIKSQERSSDQFKGFEAAAKDNQQSVSRYLYGQYENLMAFAGGDAGAGVKTLQSDVARYGWKQGDTMRSKISDFARDLSARQTELEGMKSQMESLNAQIAEKEAQLKQANEAHQKEVAACEGRISSYRDAGEDYRKRLEAAIADLNKAKDTMRGRYEGQITDLQNEVDELGRKNAVIVGQLDKLEKAQNEARLKAGNPALLVDGHVIDAPGANDTVYIDRGKKDRIVRGMTFEVFGDQAQLAQMNKATGELPRGKASLLVTSVGETTSQCRITRSSPNTPIIAKDVVANAVYDPAYKFKFLVHGKFDVDNDGKPTEQEAEYLRSLVVDWGGTIVTGDELPGDLDFLVLGVEPPKPSPLPEGASAVVIEDWARKNEANAKYNALMKQAVAAQIPLLNANRFFILIGHADR